MSSPNRQSGVSRPHWDGSRVLFEIADGDELIPCAISRSALQDVSQRRHYKAAELLLCFVEAWPRIEAIAFSKLRARSGGLSGTLNIWADDINDQSFANTPGQSLTHSQGTSGEPTGRPA